MYYAIVKMTTDKLTDAELAALNNVAQLKMDPRNRMFGSKADSLFTETVDGHPAMHGAILGALAAIVNERLPG